MATKLNLIECEEPKVGEYPAVLCSKCHRTMRGNGRGRWYCSNCGKWWREAVVLPTPDRCVDGGEHKTEKLMLAGGTSNIVWCEQCGSSWIEFVDDAEERRVEEFRIPTCHKEEE